MADLNTAEGDEVGSVESNSPQAKRKSNDTGYCAHPNEQLSNLKLEVNGLRKMFEEESHKLNTNIEEVAHQVNTMQKNVEDQSQQTKLLFVEVKKAIEHSNDAYDAMASIYDTLEMKVLNAKKGSPDVCLIGASAPPISKGKAKEGDLRTQSADESTDLSIEIDGEQTTKGKDDKNESVDDASSLEYGNRDSGTTYDTEQQSPIISHLRDYAERSTMHGVLRLFINSRNLRMFWAILLIGALGISTWQFAGIFQDYFEYPVYVDIKMKNELPAFPHILLCIVNPLVKKSAFFQHPVLKNVTRNFTTSRSSWWYHTRDLPKDDLMQLSFTPHDFMRVSIQHTDTGRTAYTPTRVLTEDKRICYSIDPQENRDVQGISIVLNANKHDCFYFELNCDISVQLYLLPGYKTFPYQLQARSKSTFRVNTFNWIKFQLEKYNRLNGVYGQCQDDEELFRKRTGFNYTRELCERECRLIYEKNNCKCYTESISFPISVQHPDFSGVRKCSSENDWNCIYAARRLFTRNLYCQCKVRCQTSIYTSNIREYDSNVNTYSYSYYCDIFNSTFCSNETNAIKWIGENIGIVYISPLKHSYKEFTQKPLYPFSRFISDIGGTLGFYCGSSVLTVFEVIQLVLALMMFLFSSLRARYQA